MTRQADPLQSAEILENIAKHGDFPLLYRDAAQFYAGFGRFSEAIQALRALLKGDLPDSLRESIENQLECYELANAPSRVSDTTQGASGIDSQWLPESHTKKASPKSKPKGKGKGRKKGKGSESPQAKGSKKSHPLEKDSKARSKQPGESVSDSTDSPFEVQPEESLPNISGIDLEQTSEASTSYIQPDPVKKKPTVSSHSSSGSSSHSSSHSSSLFVPEGSWLSDHDPKVGRFYSEINPVRNSFDLKVEAALIGGWLEREKHKPVYGRVCEEAAWFYLRQLEMPFDSFELLPGDHAEDKNELFHLAGQWLSKTEACYLNVNRGSGSNADELEYLILQRYDNCPDLKADPEYRKRLRSICSSRGHLYSLMATHSTKRKQHSKMTERYRAFYQLKTLADPGFSAS